jgi:hypothetical protein
MALQNITLFWFWGDFVVFLFSTFVFTIVKLNSKYLLTFLNTCFKSGNKLENNFKNIVYQPLLFGNM